MPSLNHSVKSRSSHSRLLFILFSVAPYTEAIGNLIYWSPITCKAGSGCKGNKRDWMWLTSCLLLHCCLCSRTHWPDISFGLISPHTSAGWCQLSTGSGDSSQGGNILKRPASVHKHFSSSVIHVWWCPIGLSKSRDGPRITMGRSHQGCGHTIYWG